jgi:hypothetical protein
MAAIAWILEDLQLDPVTVRTVEGDALRPSLAGDHDRALDSLGAGDLRQDVAEHRLDDRRPGRPIDGVEQALLRRPEPLHRDDRRRPHPAIRGPGGGRA